MCFRLKFWNFLSYLCAMQPTISRYLKFNVMYPTWINESPAADLEAIVVIPAYNEQELILTLKSLLKAMPFSGSVEVIVVFNDSEAADQEIQEFHKNQLIEFNAWAAAQHLDQNGISFYFIHATQLPKKKAGVGLARKIGMDEAFRRWAALEKNGPIVCLDADTLVADNYLVEIISHFSNHPKCPGISIAYEHPLEGLNPTEREAIVLYELHLRYFLAAKKYAGFPFAFETIGSAMAVRAQEYAKQGGMNVRKAGEDFYFLNKFSALPHFKNLNSTKVFPSARISERVPFGTGRAIGDMLKEGKKWLTYSPETIETLFDFYSSIERFYEDDEGWRKMNLNTKLMSYLAKVKFSESLSELKKNTNSYASFKHRFFRKYDAFQIMKMLHFFEAEGVERIAVNEAANWLLGKITIKGSTKLNNEELLMKYRNID